MRQYTLSNIVTSAPSVRRIAKTKLIANIELLNLWARTLRRRRRPKGERQERGTRDKPSRYRTRRDRYRLDTGLP
jgi:hypothetical protein